MLRVESQGGHFYFMHLKPDGSSSSAELPHPRRTHSLIPQIMRACNTRTGPGEGVWKRSGGCLSSGSTQHCEGPGERTLCHTEQGLPLELIVTKPWGHRSRGCSRASVGVRLEGLWRDGATGADLELFQSKRKRREIQEEERVDQRHS